MQTRSVRVAAISLGMESSGCDRGPGSDATGASLRDVWSAEQKHGANALVEVALHGAPETRITALRALRSFETVDRGLLEALLALTVYPTQVVKCVQRNADEGMYRLQFSLASEARKTFTTFAAERDAERVRQWYLEKQDRSVCASDPDRAPLVLMGSWLVEHALDHTETREALVLVLTDARVYEEEKLPVLRALFRVDTPEAIEVLRVIENSNKQNARLVALARSARNSP